MADINVQRKRTSVWPWIVGLIAAALLIWVLAEALGGDDAARGAASGEIGVHEAPAPPVAAGLRVT